MKRHWATLHILAQKFPHQPAHIVGTAEGLRALRDAINYALKFRTGEAPVMCDDGEGYHVCVTQATGEQMAEVPAGYTEEGSIDQRWLPKWAGTR